MSETSYTPTFTERDRACRPRLYIPAGIPGCGKSTWARNFFKGYQIVSTDAIRAEKWPGEPYQHGRNIEVFDIFHDRIDHMLYKGGDVVADATSLVDAARARLRRIASHHHAETHLIFFKNLSQAVTRNSERLGNACVPDEAMQVMLEKFTEAVDAIMDESYTSITIIEGTT